jgi:hypothetical protein
MKVVLVAANESGCCGLKAEYMLANTTNTMHDASVWLELETCKTKYQNKSVEDLSGPPTLRILTPLGPRVVFRRWAYAVLMTREGFGVCCLGIYRETQTYLDKSIWTINLFRILYFLYYLF